MYVPMIVSTTPIFTDYREEFEKGKRAQFWELSQSIEGKIVSAVIRQIENGPKHYFSVKDFRI